MAEYYLDTDVVGGLGDGSSWANAFASLSAAVSGLTITEDSTLNCRGVNADTTPVILNGMGADTYTLTIKGDNTTGKYSTSHYRIESTTGTLIQSEEAQVNFENIQFKQGNTSVNYFAIDVQPGSTLTYTCNIKNCILDINGGRSNGFFAGSGAAGSAFNVESCIAYNHGVGTSGSFIRANDADVDVTVKNFTGYDSTSSGIRILAASSIAVYNSVIRSTADDFEGTFDTIDYCASDDGDGTNAVTLTQTDAQLWTDAPNGDFSIKDTSSQLYDAGSATNRASTDITGASWTTDDIGAVAYSSGSTILPSNVTDGFTFSDTVAKVATFSAVATETMNLADTDQNIGLFLSQLTDSFNLSDSNTALKKIIGLVLDNIGVSESSISRADMGAVIDDNVQFSESLIASLQARAVVSEIINLSDLVSSGALSVISGLVNDVVNFSDNAQARADLVTVLAETFALSDGAVNILSALAASTDDFNISDAAFWQGIQSAFATDNLAISDQTINIFQAFATAAESVQFDDTGSVVATFSLAAADVVQFAEAIGTIAAFRASVADGVNVTATAMEVSTLPNGKVSVSFDLKVPGVGFEIKTATIVFNIK